MAKSEENMKIIDIINRKSKNLAGEKVPTIAFLGDSVTQGCFQSALEVGKTRAYDSKNSYIGKLSDILSLLYPEVPINYIRAGVGGENARRGLARLERDVIAYKPDLTVVSFGLNDCCSGIDYCPDYCKFLKEIFTKLTDAGSEVIFMTSNMMCTYTRDDFPAESLKKVCDLSEKNQNNGTIEKFYDAAKAIASECGVNVCDVYSKWKMLYDNGVDTTALLANHINHPIREMHWLYAYSLVETMMK